MQPMAKILEWEKSEPSSVRGENEEEIRKEAAAHAKEHGVREVTPELIEGIKANIRDANQFSPGNPG